MKKVFFKFLLIFVLIVLLTFTIFSCSSGENSNNDAMNETAGENDNSETEDIIAPDIPKKDYGGADFNILNWTNIEDQDGEIVNDAMFRALSEIKEQININFVGTKVKSIVDIQPSVSQSVMAGDNAYHLILEHCIEQTASMAIAHILYNLNNLPGCDFKKPYWNQTMNDTLAVQGILLYAVNRFIMEDPEVIFFNKQMVEDYTLEYPYELVRGGKWTWDKLAEMSKVVSMDLNGDGIFDISDQYGFSSMVDWQFVSIQFSCDQLTTRKNEDGYPVIDVANEKMISIVEKIYNLIYTDNKSYVYPYHGGGSNGNMFAEGRLLFQLNGVGDSANLRSVELSFGILPLPKYDELQKNYVNNSLTNLMCVPIDIADPERTGIVMELLGYKYDMYVKPAYYDIYLKVKAMRDDESAEMLDIIFDNLVYDFGLNFGTYNAISWMLPRMLLAKSTDVTSYIAQNIEGVEKTYKNICDTMIKDYAAD